MLILAMAAAMVSMQAGPGGQRSVAQCVAGAAAPAPVVEGVTVTDLPAREGAYRMLRLDAPAGSHLVVHYDAASEAAARRHAGCLGRQLLLLRDALADDRSGAEWHPVVFTTDRAYAPPRGPGVKPRWIVAIAADGTLTAEGQTMLTRVIPHEQVHGHQYRNQARLPRWVAEGHASWVGLRVTRAIDPAAATEARDTNRARLAAAKGPLKLAEWGSVRPKREAIMRQVSPEEQERMRRDPRYFPQGAFRFTSADFIGDESDMPARYGAALAVFEQLERRHGAATVRAFVNEATRAAGVVTPAALDALAQRHFGGPLADLLATPVLAETPPAQ